MDFTKQLITAEGEKWEHDEQYVEKGVPATRKVPLTYFKVARESLIGLVGNKRLNNERNTKRRVELFEKIRDNKEDCELSWGEKQLLKKLVLMRFDPYPAVKLIERL